jgi:hypothetical protein
MFVFVETEITTFPVHANLNVMIFENISEIGAGELTALVCIEDRWWSFIESIL